MTELADTERLLNELARRLGVEVRYESVRRHRGMTPGGLCRLREQRLILIDQEAPPVERIGVLLEALAQFDVESLFVSPVLRRELRRRRH